MIKRERLNYKRIKNGIEKDYKDFLCKETYNLTFKESTAKILYEYWRQIEDDRSEKVMIFTYLVLKGFEYGELYPKVEEEILKIIRDDKLLKFGDEFEYAEFQEVYRDLEKVKSKLL